MFFNQPPFKMYQCSIEGFKIANDIALEAHDGQFRRDGRTPHIIHPQSCASRAASDFLPADLIAAMLLHDVVEDGPKGGNWESKILKELGPSVLSLVLWLTKPDFHSGVSWNEKLSVCLDKLAHAPILAKIGKLIDINDNFHDLDVENDDRTFVHRWMIKSFETLKVIWTACPRTSHEIITCINDIQRRHGIIAVDTLEIPELAYDRCVL